MQSVISVVCSLRSAVSAVCKCQIPIFTYFMSRVTHSEPGLPMFESAPVPSVVKSYKMAASISSRHYTGCKMICHSSSLFLIENENDRI